jgi:hypothetical protein
VDDQASRWGIHEGTTHVWFEVERPRSAPRRGEEARRLTAGAASTESRASRGPVKQRDGVG